MNVLYIHGMGGGGDSRIPSILAEYIDSYLDAMAVHMAGADSVSRPDIHIVVRTYSFDPDIAWHQISSWVEDLSPVLIVGESLGSLNAIRIKGIPHILVSPSLNAPLYLGYLAPLTLVPGVTWLLDRIYRPREGDRQSLHFIFRTMCKYIGLRKAALENAPYHGGKDYFHAFFGSHDHYRKSGIVSIRTWRRYFGGKDTYTVYDGTHFMEEEFVLSLLLPEIVSLCLARNADASV